MTIKLLSIVFLTIVSCQPKSQLYQASGQNIELIDTSESSQKLEALVKPFRENMALEMNTKIGVAASLLNNSKTAIESDLGNWMADVVFEVGLTYLKSQNEQATKQNTFALLNKGGIRAPINKGVITTGDVFKVMPFENKIVVLKIAPAKIKEMLTYLVSCNGQPVSNTEIIFNKNSHEIWVGNKTVKFNETVYIVTSDYLAKGGDKMFFLQDPIVSFQTGTLIREALLSEVKKNDTIIAPLNTGRLKFEQ